MHRVYFDGNTGPDSHRYGLWLNKSREDLAKIPGGPREGLMVTIYMIGEIEMEATLEWDANCQAWTARPVAGRTRNRTTPQGRSTSTPASYLALLRTTNGGEGPLARQPFYLQLDSAEVVTEAAEDKQHEEFFPGFVVIGSNGAGEFIALDGRTSGLLAVVAIDMTNIDLDESVLPIAPNFDAFIDLIGIEATDRLSD